jgi:predicted aldo/keto reductase-like oxidoreductase
MPELALLPPTRRSVLAAALAFPRLAAVAQTAPFETRNGVQYRALGRTGLKVSSLGFGCMITSDESVIRKAADLGINYFDTARVYQGGNNERMVGDALKSRRKDVILSTKTVSRSTQDALGDLARSLIELRTDYVDIWYLHGLSGAGQITPSLLNALAMAKKSGKIRFAGVSTHGGQAPVIREAIKSGVIDVVLTSYNFAMEQALIPVIEQARKAGLGVVAMKVMAGGFRSEGYYPSPGRLRQLFKREGALLAALKWVLGDPNVSTAIPSMVDMDQLEENFKAMSQPFNASDAKLLSAHLEDIRPLYCRMCGRCESACAKGLPVADVLRCLTYAEGYGQFALARESYRGIAPSGGCGDCAGCTVRCPYGVDVGPRMRRAEELFA